MKAHIPLPFTLLLSTLLLAAAPEAAEAQFVVADEGGSQSLGYDDAEITPDGRYGVLRENTAQTKARVYDLKTGAKLAEVQAVVPSWSNVCEDAVAVTDTRGCVIGCSLLILDLTNLATAPLLAEHPVGHQPRDLEITPDGTMVVVRGGLTDAGYGLTGGMYIFDLATGNQLAYAPGEAPEYPSSRHSFDVDSVVVDDDHAVCTSVIYSGSDAFTRVTIWDLHPTGGGAPQVVFETGAGGVVDQHGGPHDIALTPDGTHVAVRSELGVGCYALNHASSTRAFYRRLFGEPGPFGDCALDSVEVTNDRIATISRQSNPAYPIGAQVDLFDLAGDQKFDRILGDPHDLAIDETGTRLVVRTHTSVHLYDLAAWPVGPDVTPLHTVYPIGSTHTSWGAGMDSVAVHGTRVVSLFRVNNNTEVYVHEIGADVFEEVGHHTMDDKPVDLAITPGGTFCAVSGTHSIDVIDLGTGTVALEHEPVSIGSYPWCDGVVVDDDHALAFGVQMTNCCGWLSVVDLFSASANYCSSSPNSVGPGGHIHATGSPSVSTNDLELWATGVPAGEFGLFFYGAGTDSTPYGNGWMCVGGPLFRFSPGLIGAGGIAGQPVDYTTLPAAGAITVGSTWRFQFHYRDHAGGGAFFNLTEGLEILFGV